jgi:predicted transcriptional regulator
MLVRDVHGRLIIIFRNECKNEKVYNEKIYNLMFEYTNKYKSMITNNPKLINKTPVVSSKYLADD